MSKPWWDADTLRRLYIREGMTLEEVGGELGCGKETVRRWLNRRGIETRDRSEWEAKPERQFDPDPEWLREQYHGKGKTTTEIAEELGCVPEVVRRRLHENGIEVRSREESNRLSKMKGPVNYHTTRRGYETWSCRFRGENTTFRVHRLIAVAEFGIDAVKGKVVHHKNGIGWDNRPENLKLMTNAEHTRHHNLKRSA